MQTNIIRIVAAVVDTRSLTLYKESGESMVILQGDPRVRRIVDAAIPLIQSQGYADVDVSAEENLYSQFEVQTNGMVKLYRIAKEKIKHLFDLGIAVQVAPEPVTPLTLGTVPGIAVEKQTMRAVEEIMQHAVSVSHPEFNEEGIGQQGNIVEEGGHTIQQPFNDTHLDTLVAVVDGKIIPGMEKIKNHFTRAAKLGSTKGVEAFLRRLASVIEQRSHSVEDLLNFMERGDLPIADDGSILIYKVLNRVMDESYKDGKVVKERGYVDCHSGKVFQFVGAYVCMDPSMVDRYRGNECSNGLHVARRGYIRQFRGDVCVLAKLAPEDVIAVPSYDANKMRVCGYHIIMELSDAQYSLLKNNKPITNDEAGKSMLARAMSGQHIHRTHEVRITGQMGEGVQVTKLKKPGTPEAKKQDIAPVEALDNASAEALDEALDPKDVVKKVAQVSRKEQATKLYADYQAGEPGSLEALMSFKKAAKVGWEKLGVPNPADASPVPVVKPQASPKAMQAVAVVYAAEGEGSTRERIQKLLSLGLTSVGTAQAVLALKKKSKKSWEILGVTDEQVAQILKLARV